MYRVATSSDLVGAPSGPAWTNRLANETSPYLLQHAHNPVDWHPWGAEAFDRASRDPWVESQLEQSTRLFATNYQLSRISRLPQLVIGTNIVVGNFRRVDALYQVLSKHLNLVVSPPPAP